MQDREDGRVVEADRMMWSRIPFTTGMLVGMKTRAMRRGVWFRVLSRLERASVDLTIKVVDTVRSSLLSKLLGAIVEKLSKALESKVTRMMREVGSDLAQKVSRIAQTWGNPSAVRWAVDAGFIQYLTITHMNTSPMFSE